MEIGYKNGGAAEVYYFVTRNAQGDITAIYDAKTCTLVGSYTYDAWGRVLSATAVNDPNGITEKNPFRYRGYYYDRETGFYYLQSRYYDPGIGRFVNADNAGILTVNQNSLVQYNLFAYCLNNPINRSDPSGHIAIADDLLILGILAVGMALLTYVNSPEFQRNWMSICSDLQNGIQSLERVISASDAAENEDEVSVETKDLKRLPDNKVDELGGEDYTQPIKGKTGKSQADLYWNPKTGDVYSIPKNGGTPEYVDKIPTGR